MITTRVMEERDIPFLVDVSELELDGFMERSDYESFLGSDEKMCLVAEDDGVPAGMMVFKMFGPELEHQEIMLPDCPERDLVLSSDRIAFIDALAVSEDHKGKGVGTVLCGNAIDLAAENGCDIVCAMAWKDSRGTMNVGGVLKRMGLVRGIELQGYWNRLVPGIRCRVCTGPCTCNGVFWYLTL